MRGRTPAEPFAHDEALARLLVQRGLVPEGEVALCLRLAEDGARRGRATSPALRELLLARGLITADVLGRAETDLERMSHATDPIGHAPKTTPATPKPSSSSPTAETRLMGGPLAKAPHRTRLSTPQDAPEASSPRSPPHGGVDHATEPSLPASLRWELGGAELDETPLVERPDETASGAPPTDLDDLGDAPEEVRIAAVDPRRRLGRYILVQELGAGGMGVVYRAWDARLHRTVAIKTILPHLCAKKTILSRFEREAEAAARLQHPSIVGVLDFGHEGDRHFYVMPFVDGTSLRHLLLAPAGGAETGEADAGHRSAPLPDPKLAAGTLRAVAQAVDHAHCSGIVHRDLKPDNILIDREGRPHVTDFGIALIAAEARREGAASLTAAGQAVGTPAYMSPEQIEDSHHVDGRSDVYGLGMILYECLTGRLPFNATGNNPMELFAKIASLPPDPPSKHAPDVPPDLETICLKCLEKDPRARYATASELSADLARWLAGDPILARPLSPLARGWRALRRHRVKAIVGALIVGAAAAAFPVAAWLAERTKRADALTEARKLAVESPREALAILDAAGLTNPTDDDDDELATLAEGLRARVAEDDERLDTRRRAQELLDAIPAFASAEVEKALLDQVLETDPTHALARVRRGVLLRRLSVTAAFAGDREAREEHAAAALEDLDEAIRLEPELASAYIERGNLRLRTTGDREAARADFDRGAALDPSSWLGLYAKGTIAEDRDELEDANRLYTQALELNASFPDALGARASVRHRLGRADEALEDVERGLKLRPDSLDSHNTKGLLLKSLDRLDEAEQAFDRGIALFPDSPALRSNRASTRIVLRKFEEALDDADHVIAKGRAPAEIYHDRALALFRLGRDAEVIEPATRAIELRGRYATTLFLRGQAHFELRQFDEALADLDAVIADPEARGRETSTVTGIDQRLRSGQVVLDERTRRVGVERRIGRSHMLRGMIRASRRSYEDALIDLDRAADLTPKDSDIYANRGQVRAATGDRRGAMRDFKKYLRMRPEGKISDQIRKLLEKLERRDGGQGD